MELVDWLYICLCINLQLGRTSLYECQKPLRDKAVRFVPKLTSAAEQRGAYGRPASLETTKL